MGCRPFHLFWSWRHHSKLSKPVLPVQCHASGCFHTDLDSCYILTSVHSPSECTSPRVSSSFHPHFLTAIPSTKELSSRGIMVQSPSGGVHVIDTQALSRIKFKVDLPYTGEILVHHISFLGFWTSVVIWRQLCWHTARVFHCGLGYRK